MRVLLDARLAYGGIERVVRGLAEGLRTEGGELDVELFGSTGAVVPDDRLPPLRRLLRPLLGNLRTVVSEQVGLARAAKRGGFDVAHSPHGIVPPGALPPWIVSVWDLSPLDPALACGPRWMRAYRRRQLARAVGRAGHVVVPSGTIRDALTRKWRLDAERISVIPPLFSPHLDAPPPDIAGARTHLLHVGTIEPRKNLGRLLDAYQLLDPTTRPPLVLAGRYGWRQRSVLRRIETAGDDVRWLGEVDDTLLDRLYSDAAALVQPSVHEGFDLPVVEGLAAGLPVVASDIPVHREVTGGLAVLAPADDARGLAEAIRDVLDWSPERRRAHAAAARARVTEIRRCDPVSGHRELYIRVAGRSVNRY